MVRCHRAIISLCHIYQDSGKVARWYSIFSADFWIPWLAQKWTLLEAKKILKYDEGNTCSKQLHDFFSGCQSYQSSLNNFMSFRQVSNKIAVSKTYPLLNQKEADVSCQSFGANVQILSIFSPPPPKKKLTASLPLKMNLVGGFKCRLFMFTPIWGRFPFWPIFFKGVGPTN